MNLRNVPSSAWLCITAAFLAVVAAFVVLSVTDSDTTEFSRFLNIVFNACGLLLGGGGLIYAGAAAKNSQDTKEQTNGQLDIRIQQAVRRALSDQRRVDVAPGGEFRRDVSRETSPEENR